VVRRRWDMHVGVAMGRPKLSGMTGDGRWILEM